MTTLLSPKRENRFWRAQSSVRERRREHGLPRRKPEALMKGEAGLAGWKLIDERVTRAAAAAGVLDEETLFDQRLNITIGRILR